jgi:D-alanyl-D-alanine-carboxypeptidase/D-alanyl-D-alanine-endopeptidase
MMRRLLVSLFSLVLIAALQTPARAQRQGSNQSSLPDLKSAEALGEELYENTGATGMVLVVVRGNQVFFRGYGETTRHSNVTPDANSVVRLCSLTKIFTTDLLAKLVADNTVKLDDPLSRWAPMNGVVPSLGRPITLKDLATHTAGLSREIGTAPRGAPHFTYPDQRTRWIWLAKQKLTIVPGTESVYSNVGLDFLADALSQAAHKPYATLLHERTLVPLRMWQTTLYPNADQCARLMQGSGREELCTPTFQTAGAAGLYSTPADMANWLKYLLGTGAPKFPSQPSAAQGVYVDPVSLKLQYGLDHAGKVSGIGLGWMHLGAESDPAHIVEKTGGGAGYTTYIALAPARHTGLFVTMTEGNGIWTVNLFKAANNVLLKLAGLPAPPDEPFHPHHRANTAGRKSGAKAAARAGRSAAPRAGQKSAAKNGHAASRKAAPKSGRKAKSKAGARSAPKAGVRSTPKAGAKATRKGGVKSTPKASVKAAHKHKK